MQSAFGFVAYCFIAWVLSKDRRALLWCIVVSRVVTRYLKFATARASPVSSSMCSPLRVRSVM